MPDNTLPALVTGGTGFLGRHIVERLLSEGRPVTILARRENRELAGLGARFVTASLDDTAAVLEACKGAHTVFHMAAKVGVWGATEDFFRTNVLGTRAVIEGCRQHGVRRLVYTSTPSVVFNGRDLADADESLPLTTDCPCAYPLTKAVAEREVLAANTPALRTVALRPHLIWGVGDPHLVPRMLERARSGKLRIVGDGGNRVDMVHILNATDAHLLAERALGGATPGPAAGKAYFISNGEPVDLWDWINALLTALGEKPIERHISLRVATTLGTLCEGLWKLFPLKGEPPMTRFMASELAKDHWFNIAAARRDLGYQPRITMQQGTRELVAWLKSSPSAAK
jgi:nucleoside-diphosphate-sugar epimerase